MTEIPSIGSGKFEKAENLKKESIFKWGNGKIIINDLSLINSFAYFNYQREKVLIKTYPRIARQQKLSNLQELKASKNLKPNRIVEIPRPIECLDCKGIAFTKYDTHKRIIIDLKISKSGIRKFVTLYHISRYKCRNCSKIFTPEKVINKSKYGRSLNCWVINQSIRYRISYNKISAQLKEYFDIDCSEKTVERVKTKFSEFYKSTFNEIVDNVKSSFLIHIDETIFHIGQESCYVWVFTNIDTVFYLFRPTREAEFLKELLLNFKGVLISDFYAGYDAINCPKQRCLIHLIRDLNDDFVQHQLNEELKIIVITFSKLLNEIMLTINRFGLKKRNLNKHKKAVNTFFKSLSLMDFETEICTKWQKRFNSFKNELFTFLDYDGIPWNNNNAETAIKAVALYRREYDGLPTKTSIQENLTLLSIQQTCKYRGLNFFEFLKSGKLSIFEFQEKRK